jgi:hypothetical protein
MGPLLEIQYDLNNYNPFFNILIIFGLFSRPVKVKQFSRINQGKLHALQIFNQL